MFDLGAFDHLNWTHDGAFECDFSARVGGDLNKKFPKIQMPGVSQGRY